MPLSSERSTQEPLLSLDADPQIGVKSRKKSRRKHESSEESTDRGGGGGGGGREPSGPELAPPSSILAHLHRSTNAPPPPSVSQSPPAHDPWSARPSQYADEIAQGRWDSRTACGRSPPDERSSAINIAASPPRHYPLSSDPRDQHNQTSPKVSPRPAYRQIVRHNDYPNLGGFPGSPPNSRRSPSTHTQPPLPHYAQAHFYGAPELDLGMFRGNKKQHALPEGTFFTFDSLSASNYDVRDGVTDVLVVGAEHGLDVYSVDKKRFERIGHLGGLRGSVVQVVVLSSVLGHQHLRASQPLVAVVIHGPAIAGTEGQQDVQFNEFEASSSMMQEAQMTDPNVFETSVEIYSLKNGSHVQTLFRCPKVERDARAYGSAGKPPPPSGDLSMKNNGRFLVLSSGWSGELFIYESKVSGEQDLTAPFQCIGKVWTKTTPKTNRFSSGSSTESDLIGHMEGLYSGQQHPQIALISLSARWLAFVPPASSAQTTFHGSVMAKGPTNKVHGLSSHASPAEPQVTCQLDVADSEGFLNKVARDGAQTFMKGAHWVGSQGVSAWNNYWSKPADPAQRQYSSSYPHGVATDMAFPPTHAQDTRPPSLGNQSTPVSVLDLEKLSSGSHLKASVALDPVATFALPSGCSFLSFTPDGLKLMTASAKGDVQQVWDLMRMIHGEAGGSDGQNNAPKGPSVREVARFTRITEAKIVDAVWTAPRGARFALVTDRGTVHVFDMPDSAFQWPPPKRSVTRSAVINQSGSSGSQDEGSVPAQGIGSSISSAFGMFSNSTQPLLAAVRSGRTSTGSSFPAFGGLSSTAGLGAKGGKAVAAGVNRSVSAAAIGAYNTITHLGENRIALPDSENGINPGCVRWLTGRNHGSVAVTGGGVIKIYSIRASDNPEKGKRRPSVLGDKPAEFFIPAVDTGSFPPNTNVGGYGEDAETEEHPQHPHSSTGSFWRVASRPSSRNNTTARPKSNVHPLSHAEIDTSAAYQPFHMDSRVTLSAYEEDPSFSQWAGPTMRPHPQRDDRFDFYGHHADASDSSRAERTWAFGQTIRNTDVSSAAGGDAAAAAVAATTGPSVSDGGNKKDVLPSMKGIKTKGQMEDVLLAFDDPEFIDPSPIRQPDLHQEGEGFYQQSEGKDTATATAATVAGAKKKKKSRKIPPGLDSDTVAPEVDAGKRDAGREGGYDDDDAFDQDFQVV